MIKLNVLFLDVDGVLNCSEDLVVPHEEALATYDTDSNDRVNNVMLRRLQRIYIDGPVDILVLSSSWRIGGESSRHFRRIRTKLRHRGMDIHSVTPKLGRSRGEEVALWLEMNFFNLPFAMEENVLPNYVILDDSNDFLHEQQSRLVQTSYRHGLQDEHVEEVVTLFQGSSTGRSA